MGVHSRRLAIARALELGLLDNEPAELISANSLPAPLTPFLGRQAELDQICQLLRSPECRLLTLLGPGGIGKTRLALQSARQLLEEGQPAFTEGVYFIPLADLSETRSILSAMTAQLNFSFSDRRQPLEKQLLHFLRPKRALLIFDNFEHLLDRDSKQFLKEILHFAPHITVLVTSRVRVNLAGEYVYPVVGLETANPVAFSQNMEAAQASPYSSIKLFEQCARRLMPGFALNKQNLLPVSQICERLDGMPLAIELAASWIRLLDPPEILTSLEQSYHFLEADGCSASDGSVSLCSVFLTSWKRLSADEQLAMQKLAVFRGSFTRAMAQKVADVSLQQLLSLVDQSWLQRNAAKRFQIHELLRHYAAEQLEQYPTIWQEVHERYSAYFCSLLQQRAEDWHGQRQYEAFEEVRMEIHHIESAWRWKVEHGDWGQMEGALNSICRYHEWTGRFRDGESACETLVQKLAAAASQQDIPGWETCSLQALALAWQSSFCEDVETAWQLLEQSQAFVEQLPEGRENCGPQHGNKSDRSRLALQAFILRLRGERLYNDRALAQRYLIQSSEIYTYLGDEWGVAKVSNDLGKVAWNLGDYAKARQLITNSIAVQKRLGDRREAALGMELLGVIEKHMGEVGEAERLQRKALKLEKELSTISGVATLEATLANTLVSQGNYEEAIELAGGVIAQQDGLDFSNASVATAHIAIAHAALHKGNYAQVYEHTDHTLAIGQKHNSQQTMGFAHFFAGLAFIAESKVPEAIRQFEHSFVYFQNIRQNVYTVPLMGLGLAYLKRGQVEPARLHLLENMKVSRRKKAFLPMILSMPALVLMFAMQSKWELACQVYELCMADPMLRRSCWQRDLIGGSVQPGARCQDGEARGDFWQVMAEVHRALEE